MSRTKTGTRTSYYTGYLDLDEKLIILYGRQVTIESEHSKLKVKPSSKAFKVLQNECKHIMNDIKSLLEIGKQRDSKK